MLWQLVPSMRHRWHLSWNALQERTFVGGLRLWAAPILFALECIHIHIHTNICTRIRSFRASRRVIRPMNYAQILGENNHLFSTYPKHLRIDWHIELLDAGRRLRCTLLRTAADSLLLPLRPLRLSLARCLLLVGFSKSSVSESLISKSIIGTSMSYDWMIGNTSGDERHMECNTHAILFAHTHAQCFTHSIRSRIFLW